MLRVLSEPANLEQSAHPDDFHNNLWWVGNNPYHDDRVYEQVPLETWFARHLPRAPGRLLPAHASTTGT